MGLFRSLSGMLRVELTGADIAHSVAIIGQESIPISKIQFPSDVTATFTVSRKDYPKLSYLAKRKGDSIRILKREGLYWSCLAMIRRPVLLTGMIVLLFLAIWIPGRIFFIEVEGNVNIPKSLITETAADSGVRFGASRRDVSSERMKNSLLQGMPELQWAGVNTYGCRAVITVRERENSEASPGEHIVGSVVASRDGIITSYTVTQGNGLCHVGQAVKKGQVLISGYTDCGITITATRAQGDILASTLRNLTVITPLQETVRDTEWVSQTKYSLLIGKKRINFYKDSGISGGTCVKMYSEYVLSLPGGFQLPVKLIRQRITDCHTLQAPIADPKEFLEAYAKAYLIRQMISGSILHTDETLSETDGAFLLSGNYACTEMIGIDREEMIGEFNGKTNGTDRECGSGG